MFYCVKILALARLKNPSKLTYVLAIMDFNTYYIKSHVTQLVHFSVSNRDIKIQILNHFSFWTSSIAHPFLQYELPIIHERLNLFGTTAFCITFLASPFSTQTLAKKYKINFYKEKIINNNNTNLQDKSINFSCCSSIIYLLYISTLVFSQRWEIFHTKHGI